MEYQFGMIKSPKDERDFLYSAYKAPKELPSKFYLEKTRIKDQKNQGMCVGFSASTLKDKQERINHQGMNYETSSEFIYWESKKRDGIPNTEGTYPKIALQVLKDLGVCLENTLPFRNSPTPATITNKMYEEAQNFKIQSYAKLTSLQEIKQAIVDGKPVLGGLLVTDSFVTTENGGFINMPSGYILGGHAILLDGFDDNMTHTYKDGKTRQGFFRLVNSWSESWGDNGYGWLPYDFVNFKSDLGMSFFDEAWSSIDIIKPTKPIEKLTMWLNRDVALVDGAEIKLDQPPISHEAGRTLVPLRQTCELFGQRVIWNQDDRSIKIGDNIQLWIDRKEAIVNGKKVVLEQAPTIDAITWRTLIPLRFVSEMLGYKVEWVESERKIEIIKK